MEQAAELRRNAVGVEQEAYVATLLADTSRARDGAAGAFARSRARTAARNAAIESTAFSTLGVVEAVPSYPSVSNEFEAGWNAARTRVLDDLGRLRGALVASRRKGFETVAKPESLLSDGTFVEAIYLLWAMVDVTECRWHPEDETCVTHPHASGSSFACEYDQARKLFARLELAPDEDVIPNLWNEAKARRAHADTLAAELPEEGDRG